MDEHGPPGDEVLPGPGGPGKPATVPGRARVPMSPPPRRGAQRPVSVVHMPRTAGLPRPSRAPAADLALNGGREVRHTARSGRRPSDTS
jgi:hypothetical protein